jgi:glycosyltransferase 2 family protein
VSSRLKIFVQYLLIILATGLLIWFSLRGLQVGEGEDKWSYLVNTWRSANKEWLLLMAGITIVSHWLRAIRWNILLGPLGFTPKVTHSFLSLMVGYLVNLVIPRGGELSRCYNLYKLDKVPVQSSFGTVVVERIVDLLCLILLIGLSFILESKKLFAFIDTLPMGGSGSKFTMLAWIGAGLLVVTALAIWFIRRNKKANAFFQKLWHGFKDGLLSVFRLKNKWPFVLYSIAIWVLYFLMSYAVVRAFPSTSVLGFEAVLSLFAIGAIAMAVPLPGGMGSYHVLVPQGLVFLYAIPRTDAVAFTFIFHGWQTAILIVVGAISILVTSLLVKKSKAD